MSAQPETPTLLPCPFCGGPGTQDGGWTFCLKCGVGYEDDERGTQWNRRAPDPVRDRWVSERDVTAVHHAMCSCGGRGPDDGPCEACEFYHRLAALALGETTP